MKKVITIILTFVLLLLTACSGYSEADVDRLIDNAYSGGYEDAQEDFLADSSDDIAALIRDAVWECELTAASEYYHPEEALVLFENYLNGENVSKAELWDALDGLTVYYYETQQIDDYVSDNLWSEIDNW